MNVSPSSEIAFSVREQLRMVSIDDRQQGQGDGINRVEKSNDAAGSQSRFVQFAQLAMDTGKTAHQLLSLAAQPQALRQFDMGRGWKLGDENAPIEAINRLGA